jgi:proton glutamate symport protein
LAKRAAARHTLTLQILGGLAAGVVVGYVWPHAGTAVRPLADIFLRLIKMIVAPLIFSTLVVGIAGAGDVKTMGRIGLKALAYFEIATTIALVLGLLLVNVFKPGAGLGVPLPSDAASIGANAAAAPEGWDLVVRAVPTSIVDALARGDILQTVVFATFFGIALVAVGTKRQPVVALLDAVAAAMFKVTGYVMLFAPIGVFAAIASTVGGRGISILLNLGKLVILMYAGLVIFAVVVLGGVAALVGVSVVRLLTAIRDPMLIAFTTASSEAALPSALEAMEGMGVPPSVAGFVLPAGYSFNLDGSTLYLSLTSVFVAQLAGIHLSIGQQLTMMLTLMLASKGVAGVPRGALVVLTATLGQFNLPLEGAALLLGVDQILDMGRTAVNVMGNCVATVVVARWEHQL